MNPQHPSLISLDFWQCRDSTSSTFPWEVSLLWLAIPAFASNFGIDWHPSSVLRHFRNTFDSPELLSFAQFCNTFCHICLFWMVFWILLVIGDWRRSIDSLVDGVMCYLSSWFSSGPLLGLAPVRVARQSGNLTVQEHKQVHPPICHSPELPGRSETNR